MFKEMVLRFIDDKNTWDSFVDSNPHSLLFHKWDFLKTVEKFTKFDVLTYGIYFDTQLIGVVPLFYHKSADVAMLFSPPPRAGIPNLGFLVFNEFDTFKQDKKEKFLNSITDDLSLTFKEKKVDYVSLSLTPEIIDIRPFQWSNYEIQLNYTYMIDTSLELDGIWNTFKKDTRKKIKEAQNADIKIIYTDDCKSIFAKLQERYKNQKINLPIICNEYLEELKRFFPNNIFFKTAVLDDKIVGSDITIRYNHRHLDWLGGVRPEVEYPVNELLIWNSIEKCKENNLVEMDMAGANHKYISEFKSQFNPKIVPNFHITKRNFKGKIMECAYQHLIKRKFF
jgi:lipid II:glycine glycyltransferase (peptidoglycan interpeptide bridge formation enzyme)